MTQPLEIYTLGGLTIQRDRTPVTGFVSRKVEALLVYLACEPREHPREFLAEFFWDNLVQTRSLANLRMALSSLQQQLEPYVLVTRQIVAINPQSSVWLDAGELEAALTKAEQVWARMGNLPRAVVRELDTALKLYRGDFLAGFHLRDSQGFDDWRLMEQEHLRTRVITALHRLVEQSLGRGAYEQGIERANRLLQLDPLREEAHRQMMQLQVGAGNRSAAAAQYKTCQRLLEQELGVEPDVETTRLYQQIMQGTVEMVPAVPSPKHNLPFPSTPFVERQVEQAYIAERLDSTDCRLLSLVGPGGTGKTRLALHAALERVEDYHDGVYLVTFTSIDSPSYLIPPITAALKLRTSDDAKADLIDYLRDKHMMLVLDNFEYVLDGVSVLDDLLNHTQWLKLVVTSRERLQLQQEWVLPIGGLECPPAEPIDDLEQYAAVKLFAYSARRVQAHFSLDQDAEGIKRVCALVEGMPLGLELASAWTRVMSVAQIATQIEQSLGFLETALRNVPQRHRSIHALFEHSWSMLSDSERSALMRLSVFQSEFGLEAAQLVAQVAAATLPVLVEKFLIRSSAAEHYDMHQLLRRYSLERLEQSGKADATLEAHARYFTERVETDDRANQDEHIYDYYEDVRAALGWLVDHQQVILLLRLTGALAGFWQQSGYLSEGLQWLSHALEQVDESVPAELHARALRTAGTLAWRQGDFDPARALLQRALALARENSNTTQVASALMYLGYISLNLGNHEEAQDYFAENLEIGRALQNQDMIAKALGNLGLVAQELMDYVAAKRYFEECVAMIEDLQGVEPMLVALLNLGVTELKLHNYEAAERHYSAALARARAINSRMNMAIVLVNLAEVAHYRGDLPLAAARYAEGLPLLREIGDKLSLVQTLELIALLLIDQGNIETALQLLGAAEAQRELLGTPIIPRERERYDEFVTLAQKQIQETVFRNAWATGRTFGLDQAIDLALEGIRKLQ
jgi:predicted ATPase/DNA-binding SARP family transcriptional activator